MRPVSFANKYPKAEKLAVNLLSQLVCFDPELRLTCEQALQHEYLADWRDPTEMPNCPLVCPGISSLIFYAY